MKKIVAGVVVLSLGALTFRHFYVDYNNLRYKLVWSDEFDYEGSPDETKWGYDTGASGWGNNEDQYYSKNIKNSEVSDGTLKINAINTGDDEFYPISSARLVSKNRADFLYGKVEARIKVPATLGTWSAFWMLPTDWEYGGWPESGEIDIMEHVGFDDKVIHGSVHTGSFNHKIGTHKTGTIGLETATTEFHTYGIEWTPKWIKWFLDGEQYFKFDNTNEGFMEWPFDKQHHLILNIAVGGDWGGLRGVKSGAWTDSMEVDYVRVYQDKRVK